MLHKHAGIQSRWTFSDRSLKNRFQISSFFAFAPVDFFHLNFTFPILIDRFISSQALSYSIFSLSLSVSHRRKHTVQACTTYCPFTQSTPAQMHKTLVPAHSHSHAHVNTRTPSLCHLHTLARTHTHIHSLQVTNTHACSQPLTLICTHTHAHSSLPQFVKNSNMCIQLLFSQWKNIFPWNIFVSL